MPAPSSTERSLAANPSGWLLNAVATGEVRGLAAEPLGQFVRGLVDHLLRS
jgi:hypothetical protein